MSQYDWLSQLPGDLGVRMARCLGVVLENAEAGEGKGESPALERLEERRLLAFSMQSVSTQAYENGGGGAVYLVQRDDATLGPATASLAIAGIDVDPNDNIDAADSSDWEILPTWDGQSGINAEGLAVMPEGVGELTLTVNAVNDSAVEATEAFRVNLNEVGGTETYQTADGQIVSDDDPSDNPYKLWIESSGGASEGGSITFSVHRYNAYGNYTSSYSVLVRLKTAGSGSVSADADDYQIGLSSDPYGSNYDPSPGGEHGYCWLDFASNQDVVTFSVQAVDDTRIEAETETFKVVLMGGWPVSGQWGADVMDPSQAYGDIWENDEPATFSITADHDQGSEDGPDSLTFTISRPSGDNSGEVDVYFDLSGEAQEGSDYTCDATGTGTRRSVHFSSGQTSATFSITPVSDGTAESGESIVITLAPDPSGSSNGFDGYLTTGAPASGQIQDAQILLTLTAAEVPVGYTQVATVTATDGQNRPLANVGISTSYSDPDNQSNPHVMPQEQFVTTGADGTAEITLIAQSEGTTDIVMSPNGGAPQQAPAKAQPVRIRAENMTTVIGGNIADYVYLEKQGVAGGFWQGIDRVTLTATAEKVNNVDIVSVVAFTDKTENGHQTFAFVGLAKGNTTVAFTDPNSGATKQIQVTVEDPIIDVTVPALTAGGGLVDFVVRVKNSLGQKMVAVDLVLTDVPATFKVQTKDGATSGGADAHFDSKIEGVAAGTANMSVKALTSGVTKLVAVTVN